MPAYIILINYTETSGKRGTARLKLKAASPDIARDKAKEEIATISSFSVHRCTFDLNSIQIVEQADPHREEGLLISRNQARSGVEVWRLKGTIDAHTNGQFEGLLEEALMEGTDRIVFDCMALDYINSTGIGTLINVSSRITIMLANVSRKIAEVFTMVGINELIPIHHSVDEALAEI